MHLYECELEKMDDFDAVVHFLTHLPESININELFDAIEPFMRSSSSGVTSEHGNGKKRSFQQVLVLRDRNDFFQFFISCSTQSNIFYCFWSHEIALNEDHVK